MAPQDYFLGLDCGTDSAAYAATDMKYVPLKHKGEPMMGVRTFEAASLSVERRKNRTGRRRLHRRQNRVQLLQELFAPAVSTVDPAFFIRIRESALWREDRTDPQSAGAIFADPDFTDKEYYKQYPTIHHLLCELMDSPSSHDVRLVYIACAWLVAHRGHFLSPVKEDNVPEIIDISNTYVALMDWFDGEKPWDAEAAAFGDILKRKMRVRDKEQAMYALLFAGKKPADLYADANDPEAPVYSRVSMIKLLCGGRVAPKDLFVDKQAEYAAVESFSLGSKEEDLAQVLSQLGDDGDLLLRLKALFDWSVLNDVLGGESCISKAKVKIYEQHKQDLKWLKGFIKKYAPDKYDAVFNDVQEGNYPAYTDPYSTASGMRVKKRASKVEFCAFLKKILKDIRADPDDREGYEEVMARLDMNTFLPKQRDTDNRVIPCQLYALELRTILKNATKYLPFLLERDEDNHTVCEKIISVFRFRIPYYVGPLNKNSEHAWLSRKAEKIYPWNFENLVDPDASEDAFIRRMTGRCTYLPAEYVLPQSALCYARFIVLNELNPLKINNIPITVAQKKAIYANVFEKRKRVSIKALRDFCISEGYMGRDGELSGIDTEGIKSSLSSWFSFRRIMESGILTEAQVEQIIERITCTAEQPRLFRWLGDTFPQLSEEDRLYLSRLKFKDFGRLSRRFLCDLEGQVKDTGEVFTIMQAMWETNNTLMQLLSDKYTFMDAVRKENDIFYRENPHTLENRMDDLYLSNAVRRPIYQTLEIVKDVIHAIGCPPQKIFVEMARGTTESAKGKRTMSRKAQIQELYKKCAATDVRELSALLEGKEENELQSEKLFLYFLQLGKCMYSGKPIDIGRLGDNKLYDVDHIYPQSWVKDDSVLHNKVLVLSEYNGKKSNNYPVPTLWQQNMGGFWAMLRKHALITEEKYHRLTRVTPFTEAEQWGFIERQLVETRQSTKAIATLLKERYPDTEVVYVKAGLVAEFRQEYGLLKSRMVNDLHHAKDAYLNIVVGNIYHERFNKKFFSLDQTYSLKTKEIFARPIYTGNTCIWEGASCLNRIKEITRRNHIHVTRYAFCRKGKFFDQNPLRATPGSVLLPRKNNLPAGKYGGYCKPTASFFVLAKYTAKKKSSVIIVPIELLHSDDFLADNTEALRLAKSAVEKVLGKPVESVELPLGRRVFKINTVFSADGFRFALAGKSNGGKTLLISPLMPLRIAAEQELYVKRLESFTNKKAKNRELKLDPFYDKICADENLALYDVLRDKFSAWPFCKRPPIGIHETLVKGRAKFAALSLEEQVFVLTQILLLFSRSDKGRDLTLIGGTPNAGTPTLSFALSNWEKNYFDVRIIDQSPSGLFVNQSENLLTLL